MAYCKNCGTKLDDGAKFCPKCGNPTNGEVDAPKSDDNGKNNEDAKNAKVGCISLVVIILIIGYIFNKFSGSEDSKASDDANAPKTEQVASENPITETDSKKKAMSEEGYKDGYKRGFGFDDWAIEHYSEKDYKDFARSIYTIAHKAPSNQEEKELYDLYEEGYIKGIRAGIEAQGANKNESSEFLEKGHTYKSSRYKIELAVAEHYSELELRLYNDGSIELIETGTYPNHEFKDYTKTFECKMVKKDESKRDVRKQWYQIEGESGNEVTKMFVDMDGKVYRNFGKNDFEAVGDGSCYQTTLTRTK